MYQYNYIKAEHNFAVSADKAWRIIGSFADEYNLGQGFATMVETQGEGLGAIRTYQIDPAVGNGIIRECQTARDENGMYYAYGLIEAPMPWINYHGSAHVIALSADTCQVIWTNRYQPTEGSAEEHLQRSHLTLDMIERNMNKILGLD
ncbi:MAG: SRPBCC family protein [Pseudomonadales bacterium]|nr:SRPBCC family protein [Pseudomonadales bacterium]